MADQEFLESNIVIRTKFARPETAQLGAGHQALEKLEKKLLQLTQKKWVIKLEVDDSDLKQFNLNLRKPVSTGNSGGPGGRLPTTAGGGSGGRGPGGVLSRRQTFTDENITTTVKRQEVAGKILQTETQVTDLQGKQNKLTKDQLDLQQQLSVAESRKEQRRALALRRQQQQARLAAEGRELGQSVRQDIAGGQIPLTFERDTSGFLFERIRASELEGITRRKTGQAASQRERAQEISHILAREKQIAGAYKKEVLKGKDDELNAVFAREKLIANAHKKTVFEEQDAAKREEADRLKRQFEIDSIIAKHHLKTTLDGIKEEKQAREAAIKDDIKQQFARDEIIASHHLKSELDKIDSARKAKEAEDRRFITAAQKQDQRAAGVYVKQYEAQARREGVGSAVNSALAEGFTERPDTRTFDVTTGQFTRTRNLVRTTGNAFQGYTVEVLEASEATGRMTSRVLTGSQAMRFLGDSILNATAKVSLWVLATTLVFATVAAFNEATAAVKELEQGTILLARVGKSFRGDTMQAARELTDQIIELTQVYGGSAVEAQKAAAIFARSGQTQEQVLLSVRAALLASKIAELEVEEAAKLLSSAMLQFNISARHILPTLDGLNTLSNNYRVTTDDLLQSISRTGAVFSEHNGRLSELAAITATVSQVTARSGSEIGNALKTISSNLDRLDVQKNLFERLGISTVNFEGDAKSLGTVLLELQGRLASLSATEQKQLTLQIAGVRQRNILFAAIRESSEAVIAENKALLESGSATEEFGTQSQILTESIDRLRATLIKVAKAGGDVLGPLINRLINLVDIVLRILLIFDGLPVKVAIAAGAFLLLQRGIQVLIGNLAALYNSTVATIAASRAAAAATLSEAAAHFTASRAVGAHSVALYGLRAAGAASWSVLGAIFSPAGLMAAGLLAITFLLGSAAQAQNTYNQQIEAGRAIAEKQISTEQRKRQAIENTVTAIARLQQSEARLRKAGKEDEANETRKAAIKIAGSVGLSISSGNLKELATKARASQAESIAKERASLESLRQFSHQELEAAKRQYRESLERSKSAEGGNGLLGIASQTVRNAPGAVGEAFSKASLQPILETRGYILGKEESVQSEAYQKITDAQKEIADTEEKIATLKAAELDFSEKQIQLDAAIAGIIKDRLDDENHAIKVKVDQARISLDSTRELKITTQEYRDQDTLAKQQLKNLNDILDLTKNIGTEQHEEDFDRVNKALERQIELYTKLVELQLKSVQSIASQNLGVRNDLLSGASRIATERSRGLSATASPYGDAFAGIQAERQALLNRIRNNQAVAGSLVGNTSTAAVGVTQALRKDTEESLLKLRDLEVDKALSLLEAEKNITLERKKSADELGRSLGALSEEDKLRVRAQASYFARNPGAKVSLDDQLLLDSASGGILSRFFAGRMETLSSTATPFSAALTRAGFGSTPELEKGAAEIAALRGGRTDADILRQAQENAARLTEQAANVAGTNAVPGLGQRFANNALVPGLQQATNAAGQLNPTLSVAIQNNAFNLQPLVGAFETAVDTIVQQGLDRTVAEVERILNEQQKLNARRKPTLAQSP